MPDQGRDGGRRRLVAWAIAAASPIPLLLLALASQALCAGIPDAFERPALIEELVSNIHAPRVSQKARSNAAQVLRELFSELDPAVLRELKRRRLRVDIIHPGELAVNMVPIPDGKKPRGVPPLGRAHGGGEGVSVEVSEASLLPVEDLPPLPPGYTREQPFGTLVHELGHTVDFASPGRERAYRRGLFALQHRRNGPFPNKYASNYPAEYFAEAAAVYFGVKDIVLESGARLPSSGNAGPEWLHRASPEMLKELQRVFGAPKDLSTLGQGSHRKPAWRLPKR